MAQRTRWKTIIMTVNLVVSSYNSNVSWITNMLDIDKVYIYEKSDFVKNTFNFIKLPNVGCEHQSYLQHIVDNYNYLADITIFTQGYPFDHLYILCHQIFLINYY